VGEKERECEKERERGRERERASERERESESEIGGYVEYDEGLCVCVYII